MSANEDAESLTGVWHGQYAYPAAWLPPTAFVATLIDSGGTLSGSTHEVARGGKMMGVVEGARQGTDVRFLKVYSPASEEYQDVIYAGALNGDRTEIEGEWTVPGVWSGRFLMIRNRGKAAAETRKAAITRKRDAKV